MKAVGSIPDILDPDLGQPVYTLTVASARMTSFHANVRDHADVECNSHPPLPLLSPSWLWQSEPYAIDQPAFCTVNCTPVLSSTT